MDPLGGDIQLGRISAEKILEIAPDDSAAYTIISNLHASKGMWSVKADVLAWMKSRGIKKEASKCWVEINGRIYVFFKNGTSHPMMESRRNQD
ncbi:hypothetical protein ZOSMA_157G00050 [Zostera marina]|uniref:Pentatricopeptide repeat-containing protein n=1 Tax=Zostera marina TaxID=29655 RepID=A0A0K9PVG1_ZOSMR|nr:hypothetical protein ZOSMA_157G00050 [Zostera marina]